MSAFLSKITGGSSTTSGTGQPPKRKGWNGLSEAGYTFSELVQSPEKVQELGQAIGTGLISGVMQGFSQSKSPTSNVPPPPPPPGTDPQKSDPTTSFLSGAVSSIFLNGASIASKCGLRFFLQHARIEHPDQGDENLLQESLEKLEQPSQNGEEPLEVVKQVWKGIDKYHVVFAGFNINSKNSSDSKSTEIVENPISALALCQDTFESLKESHELNAPAPLEVSQTETQAINETEKEKKAEVEEQKKAQEIAEAQLKEKVTAFIRKTSAYSTMCAVDYCFGINREKSFYNNILQYAGEENIRFAESFDSSSKKLIARILFWIIHHLIGPIIDKTITKMVTDFKDVFNQPEFLKKFIEEKILDLTEYFGLHEKMRQGYLAPPLPGKPLIGSFDKYLEVGFDNQPIFVEAKEYTQQELIQIFQKYLIDTFIPRPNLSIKGIRIPIITWFLESVFWCIRRGIISSYFEQSKIIESLFKEGTNSINKLGILEGVKDQFASILQQVKKSRAEQQKALQTGVPLSNAETDKVQVISKDLHDAIQKLSPALLRFIEIEGCTSNAELQALNGQTKTLIRDFIDAAKQFFPVGDVFVESAFAAATTNMLETALTILFTDQHTYIDQQLLNVLEVLDENFTYYEKEAEIKAEKENNLKIAETTDTLNVIIEELSRSAMNETVEEALHKVSGERLEQVRTFVNKEKAEIADFKKKMDQVAAKLENTLETSQEAPIYEKTRGQLSNAVEHVNHLLSHFTKVLYSTPFKNCYSDVRGDLHRLFQTIITSLQTQVHSIIKTLAEKNKAIQKIDTQLQLSKQIKNELESVKEASSKEEALQKIAQIKAEFLPKLDSEALREEMTEILTSLTRSLENHNEYYAQLEVLNKYNAAIKGQQRIENRRETLLEVKQELTSIRNAIYALSYLKPGINKTIAEANQERDALRRQIFTSLEKLRSIKETLGSNHKYVQRLINPLLVLNISEKQAFGRDKQETLYSLFYPSWHHLRTKSMLNKVDDLERRLTTKSDGYKDDATFALAEMETKFPKNDDIEQEEDIEASNPSVVEAFKNLIQDKKQDMIQEANRTLEPIQTSLMAFKQEKQRAKATLESEFKEQVALLKERSKEIEEKAKEVNVKGCIFLGESAMKQRFSPAIADALADQVISKIQTLVASSVKPLNYKQLALRLGFATIAKEYTNKS